MMRRLTLARFLSGELSFRFATIVIGTLGSSVAARGQAPAYLAGAVTFGVHWGTAGGQASGGPTIGAMAWIRTPAAVGVRFEGTYAFSWTAGQFICVAQPGRRCPPGGLPHLSSVGGSVTVGDRSNSAPTLHPYVLIGGELLYGRGNPAWDQQPVAAPHLGGGVVIRDPLFLELRTRWRSAWGGEPFRNWLFVAGLRR